MKKYIFIAVVLFANNISARVTNRNIQDSNQIKITVMIEGAGENDSVSLQYWDHYLNFASARNTPSYIISQPATHAKFIFTKSNGLPGVYMTLKSGKKFQLNQYFAEVGDDILITVAGNNISFTGKGSAKYQCGYDLIKTASTWYTNPAHYTVSANRAKGYIWQMEYPESILLSVYYMKLRVDSLMRILQTYRPDISQFSSQLMAADILATAETDKLVAFAYDFLNFGDSFPVYLKDSLRKKITENYKAIKKNISFPKEIELFSSPVNRLFVLQAYYEQKIFHRSGIDYINKRYNGEQREKLLTGFALQSENIPENDLKLLARSIKTSYWKDLVDQTISHQTKGSAVCTFPLTDTNGKKISMQDLKGKAVMLEFWFTGCQGCASISAYMPRILQAFKNDSNIIFASVCVDTDIKQWKTSLASGTYTHPGYLNLYTEGKGKEHPFTKYYQLHACPKTLVIDAKGKIFSNQQPDFTTQESIDNYISMLHQASKN